MTTIAFAIGIRAINAWGAMNNCFPHQENNATDKEQKISEEELQVTF